MQVKWTKIFKKFSLT